VYHSWARIIRRRIVLVRGEEWKLDEKLSSLAEGYVIFPRYGGGGLCCSQSLLNRLLELSWTSSGTVEWANMR
jgi:hypothetical protein